MLYVWKKHNKNVKNILESETKSKRNVRKVTYEMDIIAATHNFKKAFKKYCKCKHRYLNLKYILRTNLPHRKIVKYIR